MEPNTELPIKLPDMVMCGDHPSVTKTELNAKEPKDEKDSSTSYSKLTPQTSHTERSPRAERGERASGRVAARRAGSEHALPDAPRKDARRRIDAPGPGNSALVQAALGSFRWPPYLLAVWVLVLALTHALHCLVTLLERALPRLRQLCQYFRTWAEGAWKAEHNTGRLLPAALVFFTGLLYAFYFSIYAAYSIALWSIEPLSTEIESKQPSQEAMETKVTDYVNESKSDTSLKQ